MKIAIVGNPNCGKTSLFNALSGAHQKVGNWPGVTVEKKSAQYRWNEVDLELIDLPGIYSLSAFSEDEKVSVEYLLQGDYDLILQVMDTCQLERNLFLHSELQMLSKPLWSVLNMKDIAHKQGLELELKLFEKRFKTPSQYVSSYDAADILELKNSLSSFESLTLDVPASGDFKIESSGLNIVPEWIQEVKLLSEGLQNQDICLKNTSVDFLALRLLQNDPFIESLVDWKSQGDSELLQEGRSRVEQALSHPLDVTWATQTYENTTSQLKGVYRNFRRDDSKTARIDSLMMHRYLGFPIFLLIMYLIFWATINLGGVFIDFFEQLTGLLFVDIPKDLLTSWEAPDFVITLIADGVGGGVQTLSTFVPIIFILFAMISLIETTGYMARAAVVMDRLMRLIGLPGKAFIPLLVGFGCTVPAIMATRTLENRRDRILTAFMAPFMSCGARMPVYALFAAAFFPSSGQNMVFLIYVLGMLIAGFTGFLLKNTVFKSVPAPFVMELPSYHRPRWGSVMGPAWMKVVAFLKKSGKVLLPIITVLAVLNALSVEGELGHEDTKESLLSTMGRATTPMFEPMGLTEDNWPATVGLFTGLFAKEVIVGTLNSLYLQGAEVVEDESDYTSTIVSAFSSIPENLWSLGSTFTDPLGIAVEEFDALEEGAEGLGVEIGIFQSMRTHFGEGARGRAAAFAYMIFVLLYIPCVVAVSAAWKEIGSTLSLIQVYYSTLLAWVLGVLYFQIVAGGSIYWISIASGLFLASLAALILYSRLPNKKSSPEI